MNQSITAQQILSALESHGCEPKRGGDGWKSKCPSHDGKSQSLSIGDGVNGKAVIHCFKGCTYQAVMGALGMGQSNGAQRRIVATYNYDGYFETVKYEPKGFAQRRKLESGEYVWNLKGVTPRLYRQDDLLAAKPSQVLVVEGEKDVETLRGVEILATTNHGGAGKWRAAHTAALVAAGVKTVVVVPDNDEPGRDHGNKVAAACKAAGLAVKVLELPAKDTTAYLGLNNQAALSALIASAADWTPPAQPEATPKTEAAGETAFPRKDADALEGALAALGIAIRYNTRAMCAEVSTGGAAWKKTTDRKSADLRRQIAERFSYRLAGKQEIAPLRFGAESFTEHLNALLYHLEVDPFTKWLESLPAWDGATRLAKLLTACLGAAEGPLTSWAGVYLCLGAIQRSYEPGGLLREIPILIGPQRIGKSQLLSNLLPPEHPGWFSDSLCVSEPSQKRLEAILGRVLCELSELTGFRRAELESLKSFISRRDDGSTRLAYRRDPETALRRCILVGTSNDAECLPADPSGNTRYVPIQCSKGTHVEPFMAQWRNQLWAEGLALYRKGERANLPRALMGLQAEHGEIHRRKDPVIEDAVAAIVGDGPFTIGELFSKTCPSSSSSDRRAVARLADALRIAGWSKRRERTDNGGLAYLWRLTV